MDKPIKQPEKQSPGVILRGMLLLALIALGLGAAGRGLHDTPLPWIQDWSQEVLRLAEEKSIPLADRAAVAAAAQNFDPILLDARKEEDYSAGHIPGALSLPYENFLEGFANIGSMFEPTTPFIVYCSGLTCTDALDVIQDMSEQGYTNTTLYAEGFADWTNSGGEVE